jgi:hypothetical protein
MSAAFAGARKTAIGKQTLNRVYWEYP